MMKQVVIAKFIAFGILAVGCSLPGKPALRIAISPSPGSTILYVAQEAGLFDRYDVDVHIVELNSESECGNALVDHYVDASVIQIDELNSLGSQETTIGVVLLMAAPVARTNSELASTSSTWQQEGADLLVGHRAELMVRRQEWQRVLLAFEHARQLVNECPQDYLSLEAEREHRPTAQLSGDFSNWAILGINQQDSLLRDGGPYSEINAHWQGRQFLTAAASSKLFNSSNEHKSAVLGDKVR